MSRALATVTASSKVLGSGVGIFSMNASRFSMVVMIGIEPPQQ
jgi:hypothetical protein